MNLILDGKKVQLSLSRWGGLLIKAWDGRQYETYDSLSIPLDGADEGCVFLDVNSHMLEWLVENNAGTLTGKVGTIEDVYGVTFPELKLNI